MSFMKTATIFVLLKFCLLFVEGNTGNTEGNTEERQARVENFKESSVTVDINSGIEPTVLLGYGGSALECAAVCCNDECSQFAWNRHENICYLFSTSGAVKNVTSLIFYRKDVLFQYLQNGYTFGENRNILYKIYWEAANYQDTVGRCSGEGGHLLIIDSTAKQNFFASVLTDPAGGFFLINGSAQDGDDVWMYSNGTVMAWTNWDDSEGGHGRNTGENCIGIRASNNFRWHDINCRAGGPHGSPSAFICEIDI